MGLENLSDESVLQLYENIREQVAADLRQRGHYRLLAATAKQQAERLRQELDRRQLQYANIDWR
jgi:hypothetical protein